MIFCLFLLIVFKHCSSSLSFQAGESSGIFRKTFSKLSTEYRLQFIWPHTRNGTHNSEDAVDLPRKSLSMGVIKSARSNAIPTVHKKRTTHEKEGATLSRYFTFYLICSIQS